MIFGMIIALLSLVSTAMAGATVFEVPRDIKLRLVDVINEDRRQAGVPPVSFSEELSRVADEHCREMLNGNYTSHWDRTGWKPYMRYAATGLNAYTSENISSLWETSFPSDSTNVWGNIRYAHGAFLAEVPPNDGHRRSVLDPRNMIVGIGIAYDGQGMRLVEVFGSKYAELDPLPLRANLQSILRIRGRVPEPDTSLVSISIFYEPLPTPLAVGELRRTSSYSLPDEEELERPVLPAGTIYTDRVKGTIEIDEAGGFSAPLVFWKGKPGVYTVAIWVRRGNEKPFIGALAPVQISAR